MKKYFLLSLVLTSTLSFAAYEDHFPTYFEYCTGTQWKLKSGDVGGTPGHGFTYIHGLCKDYRSAYPQVVPCDEVSPEIRKKYPHAGVGISLDKNFTNVMWIAVPGKGLMYNGNKERKAITNADVDEQVDTITKLKVFDQVISKSEKLTDYTPGTPEYLRAVAKDTMGTDHAANWARKLHCVSIPFPKDKLSSVAKFLNDSNNQYKNGPDYVWSKFSNNCVHLSINQSHALGLSKSIKLDQKYLKMLFNMALPANGFMMYADTTVLKRAPSKRKLKKLIDSKNFSEVQVGSMLSVHDAYPTGDFFITDDLTVLTAPRVLKPWKLLYTPQKYEQKYMTPENTELKANAELWLERYEELYSKLSKNEVASKLGDYLRAQIALSKKIAEEE